jgi:hypothetical protein
MGETQVLDHKVERQPYVTRQLSTDGIDLGSYLSGFVDGEGSFLVSFSRRSRMRLGWEVRPSFCVSQNEDRAEILSRMRVYFGCGSVRRNVSDDTMKYEVRALEDIFAKVIPHFQRYPLLSGKQEDFERFVLICQMIRNGDHLSGVGFRRILTAVRSMNRGGHRRYSVDGILQSIREMNV